MHVLSLRPSEDTEFLLSFLWLLASCSLPLHFLALPFKSAARKTDVHTAGANFDMVSEEFSIPDL
jgi:hypothetical protein